MHELADITRFYQQWDGASDSGLGLWLDWILDTIKPRTVIIDRAIADVERSLMALNLGIPANNFCELLYDRLLKLKKHPLVLWVPFDALNELRVMQKVWWHLRPGEAFDEGRFLSMRDLNITVDPHALTMDGTLIQREVLPLLRLKHA
jgi:hypothetical protein